MTTPLPGPSNEDRDGALASLITLLEPASYPFEDYIAALDRTQWDVSRAAEILLVPSSAEGPGGAKRKRAKHTGLENWLRGPSPPLKKVPKDTSAAPPVDLTTLLRPPVTADNKPMRAPPSGPLHLATPAAISAHGLPISLMTSPLSPPLAAALYQTMMTESESWVRNKFYLAGREVESGHTVASYARPGGGYGSDVGVPYFYSGNPIKAKPYPQLLALAADLVEKVVNDHLARRARYPLESRGLWRANVCGANRYDGSGSSVGWHADQLTYLGPYPTIASLSLGTPRAFRLRQTDPVNAAFASTRPTRTYEVTLGHNSLCLMDAGCQERFKHTVPTQKAIDIFRPAWDVEQNPISLEEQKSFTSRINITFRFYRDDFHPSAGVGPAGAREGTPKCKCGIPTLLRADQKAKARTRLAAKPKVEEMQSADRVRGAIVDDDMVFFWQCQSPGMTGDLKGCGYFRILDMKAEGRGPCVGDV